MINTFYEKLNNAKAHIKKVLEELPESTILQNYFSDKLESVVYANLINNFFTNLTSDNIKELNLPVGKNEDLKEKHREAIKEVEFALSFKPNKVDESFYRSFKKTIERKSPEYSKLIKEIENMIDIHKLKKYLSESRTEFQRVGKKVKNLTDTFISKFLEATIKKTGDISDMEKLSGLTKKIIIKCIPKLSGNPLKNLKNNRTILNHVRHQQKGFEKRLYARWHLSIDLFESLIGICEEAGMRQKTKLNSKINLTNDFKYSAILRIHARSIQISREILSLVKSGFADGANARWRSIHELAVISFFLLDNNNKVSQRYLEHDTIKIYKEAKDYNDCYKELRYPPINRKEFIAIKQEYDKLIKIYGDEFKYHNGFEWIPQTILADRNFKALEKHVKLWSLHPFYSLSCNALHGGARGFYRIGLMDHKQNKILLTGVTNYGHADPLQNTAISLLHTTVCLLSLEPDIENLVQMQTLVQYVSEIGKEAVKVQRQIEKEERKS